MKVNQSKSQGNFHSSEISVSNERFSFTQKICRGYFKWKQNQRFSNHSL